MDVALKDNLEAARSIRSGQSRVKNPPLEYRHVSIFSYMPALFVAALKDVLDFMLIGSLPGLGSVITFCFSLFIFFLLLMAGSGQKYSLTKKGIVLLIGTAAEGFLFGLNFLPLEVITVVIIYMKDKQASKSEVVLRA